MKLKKLSILLCVFCLCVNWVSVPVKALEVPAGYSHSFYSAFQNVVQGLLSDEESTYNMQWDDLNTDGIPELIVICGGGYELDSYLEVYQYNSNDGKVNSAYRKNVFLPHESQVHLGILDDKKTILCSSFDSAAGGYCNSFLYIMFDKSMNASTTEFTVYSVGEYNFIDSRGNNAYDLENLDDSLVKLFYEEFEKNGMEYTKNGEKLTEAAYNTELNAVENRFSVQKEIFTCCSMDDLNTDELLFELKKSEKLAEIKETVAKVCEDEQAKVNLVEQMPDAEKQEILGFMRIFDNWDYDGRQPKVETLLSKIFITLELMSLDPNSYYSTHYPYTHGYSQKYQRMQTTVQISVLDQLVQDVFGLQLPHQGIEPYFENIHVNFSENQAFSLSEEGCVDYGYVFDELLGLYQVAPNLYYGIFKVSDHGLEDDFLREDKIGYAVLQKEVVGNTHTWKCYYANQNAKPVDETTLKNYRAVALPKSNIVLDYAKCASFRTFDAYMDELEVALQVVDDQPNARGLAEITTFINHSLQQCSFEQINTQKNHLEINDKALRSVPSKLLKNAAAVDKILKKHNILLNQNYKKTARLDISTQVKDNAVQITFDKSAIEALKGIDQVIIYIGDPQHAFSVEVDRLEDLIGHTIQIKQIEETTYAISYTDDEGKAILYLSSPIMITLPASNEFSSVMLTYADGSESWGGQYDVKNNTISFIASYAGEYTVQDAQVKLTDIDTFSEEHRKAIEFMVSRGYFSAKDGYFNPNTSLSRYDFAKTLVGMFFAYRDDLTTTFQDVPNESMYYPYIASGENRKIIHGYEDQKFHGENEVLTDEVIAFCSRTLIDHKKYIAPQNPEDYLHFADLEQIPEWAKQDIALAVREGLIEDGGILLPDFPISRADAALMLYRLFMRLYEVQPVNVQTSIASVHSDNVLSTESIVCVAIIVAAGVGIVFLKKRKRV